MNPTKTNPPKLRELEEQEFLNYSEKVSFQGSNEMRDIIVYEFINENQYYLKSIINQTRK